MKKSSRVISTLLLGATLTTMSANVFAVESKETIEKKLLAGNNRYETAVKVSEKWEKAENVVLVNALAMADALAATPLAKLKDAPILLTDAGELTKATKERIEKLGAKNVIVVGGEGVISKAVVAELEKAGLKTERISGVDRFETSAKVAEKLDAKKVAVVNGLNGRLADALSVAAPAAENNMAILLTNGKDLGAVKDAAKDKEAVVVGGSAVVADSIKDGLKAERLGGANRNETNAEVMKKFYGDKQVKTVYVAKDGAAQENQLVDALAAGPVAGKEGAPIVLAGGKLADGQKKFLEGQGAVATVYEVGGGINTSTVKDLMTALGVKDVVDKAEVSSVKATNLKEVEVTFGKKVDLDSAEDVDNYSIDRNIEVDRAALHEDGRTVTLTLKDSTILKNQQKYELTVENIFAGDEKISAKDFAFTPIDNTLPEVKEVKALGTKAVKIVVSEPVKKADSSNFKLDGKNVYASITNDGRELILTPYDKDVLKPGDYKLNIEGLEDYMGLKSFASEHKFTVVEDKTPPTVAKATATLEKLILTFSEDVDPSTVKYDNVYFKNGDNKVKADGGRKLAGDKWEFYFSKDSNRLPGYEMTMYIEGVKDYSDNKITETSFKVKPEVDQTRPEVRTVTLSSDKKTVTVKFNKNIHRDSLDAKYFTIKDKDDKLVGIKSVNHASGSSKIVELELYNPLKAGKNTIKISGIKDATHLQNVMLDYEGAIEAPDKAAPKLDSYSVNKRDKVVVITFDKKMDPATLENKSNYLVKYKGTDGSLPSGTELTVVQDGKGVRLQFPEQIDKKDYELIENLTHVTYMGLKDAAGNVITPYSEVLNLTDVNKTTAKLGVHKDAKNNENAVATDRKTIEVKFSHAIADAAAKDFIISDVEIDEVITNNSSIVKIKTRKDLPTDLAGITLEVSKDNRIKTSSGDTIKDGAGETPKTNLTIETYDGIAPEVDLGTKTTYEVDGNKIIIPFSEKLHADKSNYDRDIVITRIENGEETKVTNFTVGFASKVEKDQNGNDVVVDDCKNLVVTVIPEDGKVASKYAVEIVGDSDGDARYIKDINENYAKAKSKVYTKGDIQASVEKISVDKIEKGSADHSTKITYAAGKDNKLAYKIGDSAFATPKVGATVSGTTAFTSGTEITGVAGGKHIGLYELNKDGVVVKFVNIELEAKDVNVLDVAVTEVTLNQATAALEVGANADSAKTAVQLSATVAPANATNKDVTWASNDPAIATVSADGLVTAKGDGTATITVTTVDGSKTAACVVTVTAKN